MSDCAIMHVRDLLAKTPLHPGRIAQVSKKCEGFRTHKRGGPRLTLRDKPNKPNEIKRNETKQYVHRRAGTDLCRCPDQTRIRVGHQRGERVQMPARTPRSRSGTAFKMSIPPITNQSPITSVRWNSVAANVRPQALNPKPSLVWLLTLERRAFPATCPLRERVP